MAEPIGDDELQRLRELWNYLRGFDADYRVSERVGPLLQILARLDAAESRAAEMQRRNALLADMLKEQGDMLSDVMVKHGEIPPC